MKPGLNEGPDLTGYAVRHETRGSPTSEWDLAIDWTHSGTGTTTTIDGLRRARLGLTPILLR